MQRQYRQHRCRGISQHVQVRRAHVQILVLGMFPGIVVGVLRLVFMSVYISVSMIVTAQPPGADQVDRQAHHGYHDGLVDSEWPAG